jgi:di-heme cytochrome c peroxidase
VPSSSAPASSSGLDPRIAFSANWLPSSQCTVVRVDADARVGPEDDGKRVNIAMTRTAGRWAWLCLVLLSLARGALAQTPDPRSSAPAADQEPITPIPPAPDADSLKVMLGKQLFEDRRLSHGGTLACSSRHDVYTSGADDGRRAAPDGSKLPLNTPTVFNAALSFRLNWGAISELSRVRPSRRWRIPNI